MSKRISRREFIKGTAAGALSMAAVGVLASCGSSTGGDTAATEQPASDAATAPASAPAATPSGTYIPGTYSAPLPESVRLR